MTEKVKVTNLVKHFGKLEVLNGIDMTVSEGEVVCIIGPSGSGKSTLLRCLNKLELSTSGEIVVDDVVITSFVNGAGTNTFPTYVSSMTKHSKNLPAVFALSTLMLLFTCVLVGVSKFLTGRSQPQRRK